MKPGANKVELKVADLWVNRLIRDLQPNATQKYAFTARYPYKPNFPPATRRPAGPVTIVSSAVKQPNQPSRVGPTTKKSAS
jgi:hypothetical protein